MIYGIYKLVIKQFFAPRDGFNGLVSFASSSLEKKSDVNKKYLLYMQLEKLFY